MSRNIILCATVCLFVLACLPWFIQFSQARPLVPERLSQARVKYDSIVETVQAATREAERSQPSTIRFRTAEPVEPVNSTSTLTVLEATSVTEERTTPPLSKEEPTAVPNSMEEPTAAPDDFNSPTPSLSDGESTSGVDTNRLGMSDVTDILTEALITAQIQQDNQNDNVRDLVITLTPNEVRGMGIYVAEGIQQPLQVIGNLDLQNESLVVRITSIKVGSIDVTADQRGGLESTLNSSIYRLLPERFVQSYRLEQGQIVVQSRKRE